MKRTIVRYAIAIALALLTAAAAQLAFSPGHTLFRHAVTDGPLSGRTLVLDAGHGGFDGGAKGRRTGRNESPLNLSITKYLREELETAGARIIMTRENEKALAGYKRADMEKRWDIIAQDGVDAAVSVHLNCFPSSRPNGPYVFYYKGSPEGQRLAQAVQNSLNKALYCSSRLAKKGDFFVLRAGRTTCILVECSFLSNPTDEARLIQPKHQKLIAAAIAKGIIQYFTDPHKLPPNSEIPQLEALAIRK